jgi:dinuclear metal center YbgI/SA1388 family protein
MSIKLSAIESYFETIAPKYLSEDWDNTGLLVGSHEQLVSKVLVCLDVTSETVCEAIEKKIDLIISHHPIIFEGITSIIEDNYKGRQLSQLIKNGIGVFCLHTNLDSAPQGVNRMLADALQLRNIECIKRTDNQRECYIGRIGYLAKPVGIESFIKNVKQALDAGTVRFIGNKNCNVEKVAVFSGAFDREILSAINSKPDVIVTGDIKYHIALDLAESGFNIIDAGHYYTEVILVPRVVKWLKEKYPELEIYTSEHNNDVFTYC